MESYYNPKDLPKFNEIAQDTPELASKFFDYYAAVFNEGELTEREKALIALAVAHTIQCPYCIDAYTQACLEKGSNLSEMTEALHVAVAIRGGASLVHGIQMRTSVENLVAGSWTTENIEGQKRVRKCRRLCGKPIRKIRGQ
jgi:4-carboxymuconolactone decarboxylase